MADELKENELDENKLKENELEENKLKEDEPENKLINEPVNEPVNNEPFNYSAPADAGFGSDALRKRAFAKGLGGQAVIEGVMMRGRRMYAMAVRQPDSNIAVEAVDTKAVSDKYPLLKLPILRGVVAFVDSLVIGMKIIMRSAEMAGLEIETGAEGEEGGEEQTRFEAFLERTFGDKLTNYVIYFAVLISLLMTLFLFAFLPVFVSHFAARAVGSQTWVLGVIEGFVKLGVFIGYMYLISRMKDTQRLFQYHGAEHKTINCFEDAQELTVENVRRYTRLHKRCGTSFLLLVLIITILIFLFVTSKAMWIRFGLKVILIPVVAGISYEFIRLAGRSNSVFVRVVSWPGLMMQHITTNEPDDSQIECAIRAALEVLKREPL